MLRLLFVDNLAEHLGERHAHREPPADQNADRGRELGRRLHDLRRLRDDDKRRADKGLELEMDGLEELVEGRRLVLVAAAELLALNLVLAELLADVVVDRGEGLELQMHDGENLCQVVVGHCFLPLGALPLLQFLQQHGEHLCRVVERRAVELEDRAAREHDLRAFVRNQLLLGARLLGELRALRRVEFGAGHALEGRVDVVPLLMLEDEELLLLEQLLELHLGALRVLLEALDLGVQRRVVQLCGVRPVRRRRERVAAAAMEVRCRTAADENIALLLEHCLNDADESGGVCCVALLENEIHFLQAALEDE
eukprot:Amastigsp_a3339_12.p3 type:complete len:311 gc:universal Amastigsp_a3339_12:566-1498(+)